MQSIFEFSDISNRWSSMARRDFAKPAAHKTPPETAMSKQQQNQLALDRRTQKESYANMCAQWPSAVQVLNDLVRSKKLFMRSQFQNFF
jgi:hypothetical protein